MALRVIWKIPSDIRKEMNPMNELISQENVSKEAGVNSLTLGIQDTISITDRYSPLEIAEADREFERLGLPTLSELRIIYSKRLRNILNKGVKTIDDYHFLKTLDDIDISESLRAKISGLLGGFEKENRQI